MKRQAPRAFTLIEMVVVLFVILLLAALVVGVAILANRKAAENLAVAQMKELRIACESYKTDHGTYPQNSDTDHLDPRKHFDPLNAFYQDSSRYLYSCLSGDYQPVAMPDGQPEQGSTRYHDFKPAELAAQRGANGAITGVRYIQDPFGYCYGYSTAGAVAEAQYREQLQTNANASRAADTAGYNPTFDLWSTGGKTTETQTGAWVKNWGN
jgi:prepilin-type N-terminal cleavage/methylation domain-containing protein